MKYKVGDIVRAKEGVRDPDFEDLDISHWQGKIIAPDGDDGYLIEWDNQTLNQMPEEALRNAWLEGLKETEMVLFEGDIEPAEERPQPARMEREFDKRLDEEKKAAAIIGDEELDVTKAKLRKYRDYLMTNLDLSTVVTGTEDFPWEEKYFFGYGDKNEYKRLKKTRPSYRDLYKIMGFEEEIDEMAGLIVKVKRLSDRKMFSLPLADLKAKDKDSGAYDLLDTYSFWFVNWR
ncbi:MAG: hypothetical protein JSS81_14400 [Acidobacteria bacterium]|nr:hypothetical protein [Acidobacteriota bacterium]